MKVGLTILADDSESILKALDYLRNTQVMVGIPDDNAGRTDGPASNAVIGYVLENGDPDRNLPPRPFLQPGVDRLSDDIKTSLSKAGEAALAGDKAGVRTILSKIGLRAVNSVRAVIDEQQFAPLAPSTLAARFEKLSGKVQNELLNKQITKEERAAGIGIVQRIQGAITILVDTGSMRNAITYVLRYKGADVG
jgi:hypothetical protein